ncbi:MAG: crossover junction endodeoxyribonuclease RuvC [Bacteroidetes bacterium]|nr:crossover junction endodeoxyribonuclease RuvC [Bacteroidota bacterium]MCL1968403.1 crossover junction endodeoxyribonuclease RuvC [Bacteroidota bacterium]
MKIILGIDPGTTILGFALLEASATKNSLIEIGTFRLSKIKEHADKLKAIFEKTLQLIEHHQPQILAIEAPFYGKNPQSMLKLGRAQGVVIAAAMYKGLEVFEYSPRKIKQSITGNGNASKEQVAAMLQNMNLITENKHSFDATDALAVAVCHHLQNKITVTGQKFSGWEAFITKNQDRIVQ